MSLPGRPGAPSTTPTPHRVNPGSMPSTRTRTPLGRVFDTLWDGGRAAASDTRSSLRGSIVVLAVVLRRGARTQTIRGEVTRPSLTPPMQDEPPPEFIAFV